MGDSRFPLFSAFSGVAFALALLAPSQASARVPIVDPLIGYAIDGVLDLAGESHLSFASSYAPANDAVQEARVRAAVAYVHEHAGTELRYSSTEVSLIRGTPDEPNAFCTGPRIFVSVELARSLDDRQLEAVLAHEMAHAERGHLTQRMTFGLSALLIQFGRLARSDAHALLHGGDADSFMQELWRSGHWQMIQNMLESATLGQEMQADCVAYQWLRKMQAAGLPNRPTDIADAAMHLLGVDQVSQLGDDDFMGPRVRNILDGAYDSSDCG